MLLVIFGQQGEAPQGLAVGFRGVLRWWRGADRAVEGVAAVSMGVGSGRSIPALTVRMARASNPRGTPAMWVRDRLDELFVDDDFAD
jgi:hypothetical protein